MPRGATGASNVLLDGLLRRASGLASSRYPPRDGRAPDSEEAERRPVNTALVAAGISAVVAVITTLLAAPLRMWVERNLQSHRLKSEYEYDQRRELRRLIGRYHGRLVEAAEQMHYRCLNVYEHDPEQWLEKADGFYFRTTAYRLLHVVGLARSFEREAFYIDARIAEPTDLDFVKFVKAFLWALVDPALFKGLEYDESQSRDHFFADQLRLMGETFCPEAGECRLLSDFIAAPPTPGDPLHDMTEFLLGLKADEDRLRWDRLVVLDLFLVGFLNTVGYGIHRSSDDAIAFVVSKLRRDPIRVNLMAWLPKLGLADQEEMKRVTAALERGKNGQSPQAAAGALAAPIRTRRTPSARD